MLLHLDHIFHQLFVFQENDFLLQVIQVVVHHVVLLQWKQQLYLRVQGIRFPRGILYLLSIHIHDLRPIVLQNVIHHLIPDEISELWLLNLVQRERL